MERSQFLEQSSGSSELDDFDGHAWHTETGELLDIFSPRFDLISEQGDIAGQYEHYKSTPAERKYYQVLCAVRDHETEVDYVVYLKQDDPSSKVIVRPLDMFEEEVNDPLTGTCRPRFAKKA